MVEKKLVIETSLLLRVCRHQLIAKRYQNSRLEVKIMKAQIMTSIIDKHSQMYFCTSTL